MPELRTTSRFRGVSWDAAMNRWTARITKNRRPFTLGFFAEEEEAARAYDAAAARFFGELARSNATLRIYDLPREPRDAAPDAVVRSERAAMRAEGASAKWRRDRIDALRARR